ncbi:MAG: aminotransferase class III-fold pyridoxal phosphate-dependent enzyme, partial [Bacteroidetes bacterium]|nr:aminotransferase class III-fold pyridoxal phosphate-dependent enzyme [Bacteroidota bacterium]
MWIAAGEPVCAEVDVAGVADAFEAAVTENTVGFLVEPLQGEGGVVVPPEGYLRRTAEICRDRRIAFMGDEIQTG